jgi:hypothetical protein
MSKGNLDSSELNLTVIHNLIRHSGFASDPDKLLVDGWGKPYQILRTEEGDDLRIASESFFAHLKKKGQKLADIRHKYPWMDTTACIEIEKSS